MCGEIACPMANAPCSALPIFLFPRRETGRNTPEAFAMNRENSPNPALAESISLQPGNFRP
jgi:hypothetical protein